MYAAPHAFDSEASFESASAIEDEVIRLTDGLGQGRFHAPTRTGGWSIGYCLEHLILTGHAFLANWDHAPAAMNSRSVHSYGWGQRALLRCVADPALLRRKTVPALAPYARHSIQETLKRFLAMHHLMGERLAACPPADLERTKVALPGMPLIRPALGFAFDLMLAHEWRHLAQAWRVRGDHTV